ncbi:MAG: hypothetical protein DRQ46_02840 [Gammaproteobacteria bacterium]|nr:MAG: hypothetical protein DRQ46_02840 [Gammaproteobacteria bacterium]
MVIARVKETDCPAANEYADGFYYLYNDIEPAPVLVQHYFCSDVDAHVFGFNIHDGGGLVLVSDLRADTTVVPVAIVEKGKV